MGDGEWEMDETYKTYTKKFARNQTENARHERRRKDLERRLICHKRIQEEIIDEWCSCGECVKGNYENIYPNNNCYLTLNEISKTCNTLRIPKRMGKVGTWQHSEVKDILFGK
jgi:hypothetical protein